MLLKFYLKKTAAILPRVFVFKIRTETFLLLFISPSGDVLNFVTCKFNKTDFVSIISGTSTNLAFNKKSKSSFKINAYYEKLEAFPSTKLHLNFQVNFKAASQLSMPSSFTT